MTPERRIEKVPNNTIQKATKDWLHLECSDGIVVHYAGGPERRERTAKDEAEAKERAKARRAKKGKKS